MSECEARRYRAPRLGYRFVSFTHRLETSVRASVRTGSVSGGSALPLLVSREIPIVADAVGPLAWWWADLTFVAKRLLGDLE